MKKKILFVAGSLRCGGAEKSLSALLSMFDHDSYDVSLLLLHPGEAFFEIDDRVRVIETPKFQSYLQKELFAKGTSPLMLVARLRLSITERLGLDSDLHDYQRYWKCARIGYKKSLEVYDAAIAWGQGSPTYFVASNVIAARKICIVNTDYIKAGYNAAFDAAYYDVYDWICPVSDDAYKSFVQCHPAYSQKVTVLHDVRDEKMLLNQANEDNPYIDCGAALIVVTVGRLSYEKGQDIALRACSLLEGEGLDVAWYFVGDGPFRGELEDLCRDLGVENSVYFVGAKSNPYPYMKHADIYVQPSRFEGYCGTLREARLLCVPSVITDFEFDQVVNGVTGFITEKTPESLASAVRRLAQDIELRHRFSLALSQEESVDKMEINKLYRMIGC